MPTYCSLDSHHSAVPQTPSTGHTCLAQGTCVWKARVHVLSLLNNLWHRAHALVKATRGWIAKITIPILWHRMHVSSTLTPSRHRTHASARVTHMGEQAIQTVNQFTPQTSLQHTHQAHPPLSWVPAATHPAAFHLQCISGLKSGRMTLVMLCMKRHEACQSRFYTVGFTQWVLHSGFYTVGFAPSGFYTRVCITLC